MDFVHKVIISSHTLIILLVVGIAYMWCNEWQEIEILETGNKQIDDFRKEINEIQIHLIEFSLLGETVLDWNDDDLEHYHIQRLAMDSMLCRFRTIYPVERIDSVRHLLEDKELQMRGIVTLLDEQQTINKKMARQVPVIVQRSVQEQPKNEAERFLWYLWQKEEIKLAVATTMLRSLNQNMIAKLRSKATVCQNMLTALLHGTRNLTDNYKA